MKNQNHSLISLLFVLVSAGILISVHASPSFAAAGAIVKPAILAPDSQKSAFQKEVESFNFAPHKALYEVRLANTKSGSQIVNITGQMQYEWRPACEAWVSNHRFNLNYEYADSPAMRILSDFSTYEPFDGKTINFTSQRKRDGELFEELRGQATVDDAGKGGAVYTMPRGLEFDLPTGSLFPMSHTLNVMKAMKEGKKFYQAVVFDGSDQDGPVEINAFIGKAIDDSADFKQSKELDASLLKSPAHQLRLAFFPLNDPKESSDYEMTMNFHDNGVISDMYIEYGDFSVTQKLIALEALPNSCPQKSPTK